MCVAMGAIEPHSSGAIGHWPSVLLSLSAQIRIEECVSVETLLRRKFPSGFKLQILVRTDTGEDIVLTIVFNGSWLFGSCCHQNWSTIANRRMLLWPWVKQWLGQWQCQWQWKWKEGCGQQEVQL
ncbi:uncharacterized protein LOC121404159 [Drosophila obscura]|uniref:uncharacterized protein LOC121404159 n=1 Tax=Drosophila obscura TaxID=7282 RepID=UPI001BB19972|nr:uncharacterized protein LOC121404159 [Drosophila obscura]